MSRRTSATWQEQFVRWGRASRERLGFPFLCEGVLQTERFGAVMEGRPVAGDSVRPRVAPRTYRAGLSVSVSFCVGADLP
jgi:hypothetical protein